MKKNDMVGPTHVYTLFKSSAMKVDYPKYTQSPNCSRPMTYTLMLDGKKTSEKWLGDNAIEGFFKIST